MFFHSSVPVNKRQTSVYLDKGVPSTSLSLPLRNLNSESTEMYPAEVTAGKLNSIGLRPRTENESLL